MEVKVKAYLVSTKNYSWKAFVWIYCNFISRAEQGSSLAALQSPCCWLVFQPHPVFICIVILYCKNRWKPWPTNVLVQWVNCEAVWVGANPHISHVGLTVGCSHTGLAAVLPFGGPFMGFLNGQTHYPQYWRTHTAHNGQPTVGSG